MSILVIINIIDSMTIIDIQRNGFQKRKARAGECEIKNSHSEEWLEKVLFLKEVGAV
jgi:hypothetical protein